MKKIKTIFYITLVCMCIFGTGMFVSVFYNIVPAFIAFGIASFLSVGVILILLLYIGDKYEKLEKELKEANRHVIHFIKFKRRIVRNEKISNYHYRDYRISYDLILLLNSWIY